MKKTKWFIYTLIVGLIPFIARLCIFLVLNNKEFNYLFDAVDFIILGLVINITNINELEGNDVIEREWKTKCIGFSIIYIVIYAVFFAISIFSSIIANVFDEKAILYASIVLSVTSVFFGYSIFNRLTNIERSLA